MPRETRLSIAKKDILGLFESSSNKVYSHTDIARVLAENRAFWRLANRTSVYEFISFLTRQGSLRPNAFRDERYNKEAIRYSWGEASIYELAVSLHPRGYLSHASAVALHGLTDLIPRTVYLNVEQSPKPSRRGSLTQTGIDRAFSGKQRQSNLTYLYDNWRVTVINGKSTGRLGVEQITGPSAERVDATGLERTLIDIVVRPVYGGGIFEVMKAYRAARERLSSNRLVATLKQLDYVYPYHQAIGFLMQRAGYPEQRLAMLQELGINYKFYLVHGIENPAYDERWQLFYPKGL